MQTENNRRFDEMNRRFDQVDQRLDPVFESCASSRDVSRTSKKKPVLTLELPSKHASGLRRLHPTGVGRSNLKRASFPTEAGRIRRLHGKRWGAGETKMPSFVSANICADFRACQSLHIGVVSEYLL